MNEQTHSFRGPHDGLIKLPAYPFTGNQLFSDLRRRLARESQSKMTITRLGEMMGIPTSTTHVWFEVYHHPHVRAMMSLLERLSPRQRLEFIEQHCRLFPHLRHPYLPLSPHKSAYLQRLLKKNTGLTFMSSGNGGSDFNRTFLFTAFGHSLLAEYRKGRSPVGIDLHKPDDFVPVETLSYIDGSLGPKYVQAVAEKIWPRILTSIANAVLLNGVWSAIPAFRHDILRLTAKKHVVLADQELPDSDDLRRVRAEVHHIVVLQSQNTSRPIRVKCRRMKP